jgi:RNA polymerase sigma-70 factor (ECF subfamily)
MNAPAIRLPAARRWPAAADPSQDFSSELQALIPQLRAFARMLCGDREEAEGVARQALAEACRLRQVLSPGANLRAWLFTIVRNQFHSSRRCNPRQASYEQAAANTLEGDAVIWSTESSDTLRVLQLLPLALREALLLTGASGCSCEETAAICDCSVGAVRSRVSRARRALQLILEPPPGAILSRGNTAPQAFSQQLSPRPKLSARVYQ